MENIWSTKLLSNNYGSVPFFDSQNKPWKKEIEAWEDEGAAQDHPGRETAMLRLKAGLADSEPVLSVPAVCADL